MDLVNATGIPAAFTIGLDPDGRERLVIVVKGTFIIPSRGGVAQMADEHDELVYADTFTGKPGFSAVVHECDFAPFKPRCDVLLVGSAHAPHGQRVAALSVGLRVGSVTKGFEVIGDRHWTAGVVGISASSPKPFGSMPISYDRAFGGPGEASSDNPAVTNAYALNPVGVGYFKRARDADVFAKPLPNTQQVNDAVGSPTGTYQPMAFGPIGRNFASRVKLAGTYDQAWLDNVFPFLPADFKVDYYQSAPPDQQMPYPVGGEMVQLLNLTPHEQPAFQLPTIEMPIEFTNDERQRVTQTGVIDTIVLEPDRARMNLVWRTSVTLRDNIREITQVVIGRMPEGWYRARERGKRYFAGLGALAAAKGRS
jgi:hypothetical protein